MPDTTTTKANQKAPLVTEAYHAYRFRAGRVFDALSFMVRIIRETEEGSLRLAEAMINAHKVLGNEDAAERNRRIVESRDAGFVSAFDKRVPVLEELIVISFLDAFESYFSDLLFSIFLKNPSALRSAATITTEDALSHASVEDLIVSVAGKRVQELSYLSLRKRIETVERLHGFRLILQDEDILKLERAVTLRNCLVHNSGVITKQAATVVGHTDTAGSVIKISGGTSVEMFELTSALVRSADERASKKFSLKRSRKAQSTRKTSVFRDLI
ncbi:MAG: hypothetical protein H7124_11740 [Phycisphaerales bacterium]|nr:hypothetical protein [Hyphomonadaceae bacterium]